MQNKKSVKSSGFPSQEKIIIGILNYIPIQFIMYQFYFLNINIENKIAFFIQNLKNNMNL